MRRALPVWSMRARLTVAMALILALTLGVTFIAVYRGTGQELRGRIDRRLRDEARTFASRGVPPGDPAAPAIVAAGRRYIAVQPFSSSARLLFERVTGAGVATNQPELLRLTREAGEPAPIQRAENGQARRLVGAPPGYSTVVLRDLGPLRLYVQPVGRGARTIATIGLGEPLAPVQRAQDSVATRFAVAGSAALLVALLASYLIASRTLRPVRRMAGVAARVDAGDLSPRIGASGARDEVRVLAEAFDHMLDRLADAFDRQSSFLADASHELRTPLTVLRGQLEVLARDPEFSREAFDRVQRLAQAEILRMQKLVDDLLLIAHSGEPAFLRPQPIEVGGYLRDLVEGARATADRRFEVACGISGQLRADPDRLAQALRNLIANATQHTRPGGLVRVTAEPLGDAVVIAVEDDGPGIPESEREAVFDRFHRTDGSRSRSVGGTGLGLAIVRAIVEAHNGRVSVEESAGGGTRVMLFLPGFTATEGPARAPARV